MVAREDHVDDCGTTCVVVHPAAKGLGRGISIALGDGEPVEHRRGIGPATSDHVVAVVGIGPRSPDVTVQYRHVRRPVALRHACLATRKPTMDSDSAYQLEGGVAIRSRGGVVRGLRHPNRVTGHRGIQAALEINEGIRPRQAVIGTRGR